MLIFFLWIELNADSASDYVNSWDFFHRSTEEIIALFISITFVLDAFKGIIKGKSCNNVSECRSLLCFFVKGKFKAANMHDVCLFRVRTGSSGIKKAQCVRLTQPFVSSLSGYAGFLLALISVSWDKVKTLIFTKWRNHNNVAVKVVSRY